MRVTKNTSKTKADVASPVPSLRVSFPDVAELRIELEFMHEFGWAPSTQVHILHPPARAYFRYPCPFAGCTGWFELEVPVTHLLREVATKFAGEVSCAGVRPRDRSTGKLCGVRLKYRLKATYTSSSSRVRQGL
jgi:hypothetical protein